MISGSIPLDGEGRVHCGFIEDYTGLNKTLENFWEIENVEIEVPKNKEAFICEEHFEENVRRNSTGRYTVKMPLKEDPSCLGKSKETAFKKPNCLWKRFVKEPEYLVLYKEFMREYENSGHMREISDSKEEVEKYYIPHLGVYHPDKDIIKLRVVFNQQN